MNITSVIFKTEEQKVKILELVCKVLNGNEDLDKLTVETLKQNYGFGIEDVALFFEVMAKYFNLNKVKSVEELEPIKIVK